MLTSAFLKKQAESSTFWQGAALYNHCLQHAASLAGTTIAGTAQSAVSSQYSYQNSSQNSLQNSSGTYLYGSATLPETLSPTHAYPHSIDFFYRYGYEFLGMAYSVYVHQVMEKINQLGIDHVMFVAREGYLFQKIYEVLTRHMPSAVPKNVTTHYAYLSRASTFLPSVSHLSTRELVLATDTPGQQGLWSTLKTLGLPPAEFESFAQEHGVDLRSPIQDYWNDHKLLNFFSDRRVQSSVKSYQQQAHSRLAQYLKQAGFFGQNHKVALVNIGWEGIIQDNLVRAFSQRSDFPLLYGLYFGLRERQSFLKYSNSFSQGLVYDSRNRNINAESVELFVEMFEKGASAPQPMTKGYEPMGQLLTDGVRPVFDAESPPQQQAALKSRGAIAVMQRGILDFVCQYAQQWQHQSFSAEANLPFVHGLITRHMAFPTYEEAYRIATQIDSPVNDSGTASDSRSTASDLGAASNLGQDGLASVAVTAQDFWHPLVAGKAKTAIKRLRNAAWRTGSFRLLKVPGLATFYRIKRFLSF